MFHKHCSAPQFLILPDVPQRERVKQRKNIKLEQRNEQEQQHDKTISGFAKRKGSLSDHGDEDSPPRKLAKKDKQVSGAPAFGQRKPNEVISSLFRHNPDIPVVKR
jgi:hypothetical protein